MSAVYDIISRDTDLKPYLNKTGTDEDTFFDSLISSYSGLIQGFIGGPVTVQTYTDEIVNGNGRECLPLLHGPFVALKTPGVADVQWRSDPTQAWANLETDASFILGDTDNPFSIRLWRMVFHRGISNIKLCYKAGYSDASVLEVFKQVCKEACAESYKESNKGDARLGRSSVAKSSGGVSVTDSYYQLSECHKAILRRYRKVTL